MGNLSDAVDLVSTEEIVDFFNVPFKKKNGTTFLICPGHDNHHFGPCHIDERGRGGYYCYACGEYVPKFQMVQKITGWDNSMTANWFFEQSGVSRSHYQPDPLVHVKAVIREIEHYLPKTNDPIYDDICPCSKAESEYNRYLEGAGYMKSRVVSRNPLLDLYVDNPENFKIVSTDKLKDVRTNILQDMVTLNKIGDPSLDGLFEAFANQVHELDRLMEEIQNL